VRLAKVNAAGRGIADLDLIVVPHPLGTRAPDEIAALGKDVAAHVLDLVARGAAQ
jgi:hypothetical protein